MALFAIARFLDNGDPDPAFGDGGRVTTEFVEGSVNAFGLAVDAEDRIITAGALLAPEATEFAFTRHLPSGELDGSFAGDGRLRVGFDGRSGGAMSVTLDSEQRIVAVGGVAAPDKGNEFAVVRLLEDGALDDSFGNEGRVVAAFDEGPGFALDVSIDPLDRIVAAGFANAQLPGNVFAVLRLLTDGTLDQRFGTNGRAVVEFTGIDTGFSVLHDHRWRIVVAGKVGPGAASDGAVARLLGDGRLDPSFGVNGRAYSDLGGSRGQVKAVALAGDRRIVLAGLSHENLDQFGIARLLPGGDHDQTFSFDGRSSSTFFDTDGAEDVVVDATNRVVAAGYTGTSGGGTVFATARLLSDGTPDMSFGLQGQVFADFVEGSVDRASAVAIDSASRIVVGGSIGHPRDWPLGHGPHRAGVRVVKAMPIPSQDARVNAVIYYPATREATNAPIAPGAPFPVAAFVHANRGAPPCPGTPTDDGNDLLELDTILRHLARWGYVVISGDASAAPPGPFFQIDLMQAEAEYMIAENTRGGSPFEQRLRTTDIVLIGHSTGGGAAYAVAASGALNVGAVAALVPSGQTRSVGNIPSLTVAVTRDDGTFGGNATAFYNSCESPKHLLTIGGANHFGFTESLCFGSDGDPLIARHDQQRIAAAYMTAFLQHYLRGAAGYAEVLTGATDVESLEPFDLEVQAET